MLWLAFVLPSPQDTIRLLKRVLALDPENERAKAGIRWAKARLGLDPDEPEADEPALAPQTQATAAETSPASPDDLSDDTPIRRQLLSDRMHKQAKKGALAQRARRTINPLLAIIFITGVVGMISIGLGALVFVPPEVLAAWLAAPAENVSPEFNVVLVEQTPPAQSGEVTAAAVAKSLTSQADTLAMETSPVEPSLTEARPMETELSSEITEPVPYPEIKLNSVEPSILIGPKFPATEAEISVPVDNSLLAHQPAYPGEKWIEINLTAQQVTAWEGNVPVFSFTASTGLPNTPTVQGEFNIYQKLEATSMTGPGYYLPGVPYTMYFYGNYALHGTYWHNNFGQPMSHGCVNLETSDAQKLFEWADPVIPPGRTQVVASANNPGTLVVVHK
jgi:lipoprotein-anchoring transpeptidase ErfK/SrfK